MKDKKAPAPRPRRSPIRKFFLGLSGFAAGGLIYAYHAQPDQLAGLTAVPACIWLVPAVLSILWFSGRDHKMFSLTVFALWALFAYTTVEEVQSFARRDKFPTSTWQAAKNEGRALRVVSFNCNVGQPQCAAEVKGLEPKPDIILFQESPSQEELQKLASELYGSDGGFVWSTDAAIVARGKVESKHNDPKSFFVHATVQLPEGKTIDAVSVRLVPPVLRYDFWSGEFWKSYKSTRRERREQVQTLAAHLATLPPATPLIVGGDFNCASEDGALLPLRVRLQDAFVTGGRGLCNTATNSYPLERVDQVWINSALQSEWVSAKKSDLSDHRMVICDLSLK